MQKIYLITATNRPSVFKETEKYWREQSDNQKKIITQVIVDTQFHADQIKEYKPLVFGIPAGGITKPLTELTYSLKNYINDDDIVIVFSDDFYPPKGWDTYLLNHFSKNKGAISVKIDGLNSGGRNNIVSLPIMDGLTLKKLNGYIYHPSYNHLYSDNELYDNLIYINSLIIEEGDNAPLFKHKHWTTGDRTKDDIDKKTHSNAITDKKIYNIRKNYTFEQRVKIRPSLSILICSLKSRNTSLETLLNHLTPQTQNKNVEIKICKDDGQLLIPQKRNKLLLSAMGDYICYVDDDDDISKHYVDKILESIKYNPDCVGMCGLYFVNGVQGKSFIHSNRFKKWNETSDIYERTPNHLNPIKREHIFKVGGFNESLKSGEDIDFSNKVFKYLKTEILIQDPIYKYQFSTSNKKY